MAQDIAKKDGGFYKWEVLILLWFAYWFNQADRQIYNALLPDIMPSLGMGASEAGLVATVFMWVLAVCFPFAGFAVDRFGKKGIIVASLVLWSAATVVSGFCSAFFLFILFRCVATGVGEGFFAPAAYSSLSEYHDKDTRATAMGIFTTAQYLGIVICGVMATWLAKQWNDLKASGCLESLGFLGQLEGWRVVFALFGSLGVLLGVVILLRLRDKNPPAYKSGEKTDNVPILETIKMFFSNPSAILLTVAFSGVVMVIQAFLTWSTVYLHETLHLDKVSAGLHAVLWLHLGGIVGILIAGKLSDYLAMKKVQYRVLMQSFGYIMAVPFIVLVGFSDDATTLWGMSATTMSIATPFLLVCVGMTFMGFFRAFYDANIYPTLYDVVPAKCRGSATGIMLFVGFLMASPGPWVLGKLKEMVGLSCGIASLAIVWLVLGIMLLFVYKFTYAKDCKKALDVDKTSE